MTTLCVGLSAACGPGSSVTSGVHGHYEDATAKDQAQYQGQQTMIHEHAPTQSVLVGLPLLTDYKREDLLQAILEAGAEDIYIMVPENLRGDINHPRYEPLREKLGTDISKVSLVPNRTTGTVWARDWAPQGALTNEGAMRFLDFNYYPQRSSDDSVPRALAKALKVDRVSVPVYNEGGNFMNNSRGDCLMTTRVTDANRRGQVLGDMILDRDQIAAYYRDFGGCRRVVIMDRLPFEGTGHIDMWGKFLNDDTVIVNQISDSQIQQNARPHGQEGVIKIQKFLEARARQIEDLGFTVIRMPMPLPDLDNEVFRSYTNALVVNDTMIVPRYTHLVEADRMIAVYEQQARQIYEAAGYRVQFIDADELIAMGGAIHCVTMQLGFPQK